MSTQVKLKKTKIIPTQSTTNFAIFYLFILSEKTKPPKDCNPPKTKSREVIESYRSERTQEKRGSGDSLTTSEENYENRFFNIYTYFIFIFNNQLYIPNVRSYKIFFLLPNFLLLWNNSLHRLHIEERKNGQMSSQRYYVHSFVL